MFNQLNVCGAAQARFTIAGAAFLRETIPWFAYKGRPAARPAEPPKKAPAPPKPATQPATGAPEPSAPKPHEPAKKH